MDRLKWAKSIGSLMLGTIIAQVISVLSSPLLTRIYGPEEFGRFGVFIAATAVLGSISAGRLELAISIPAQTRQATSIAGGARLLALLVNGLALLATLMVLGVASVTNWFSLPGWLLAIPPAALMAAWNGVFAQENLRELLFTRQSRLRVGQSTVSSLIGVLLGVGGLQRSGLFGATYASQGFVLLLHLRVGHRVLVSLPQLLAILKKYQDFPKKQVPATLIETGAGYLPIFFIAPVFGAKVAGFFFLAQTILRLPVQFLSNAVGEIFRQWLSRARSGRRNVSRGVRKMLLLLAIAALVVFGPIPFVAPTVVPLIFGDKWSGGVPYLTYFSVLCGAQFIASPLSVAFYLLGRQGLDFIVQLGTALLLAGALLSCVQTGADAETTVKAFVACYVIRYGVQIALVLRMTKEQ